MKIKINLLPFPRKEELKQKRSLGVIIKIGSTAFAALLVFCLFLLFCSWVINIRVKSVVEQQQQLMENKKYGQIKEAQIFAENYYKRTAGLDRTLKQQNYYWDLFNEINQVVPAGIYLKEIALQDGAISINGFSSEREDLLKFKEALEANKKFSKIDAPISNFTSSEDINFSFKAEIK